MKRVYTKCNLSTQPGTSISKCCKVNRHTTIQLAPYSLLVMYVDVNYNKKPSYCWESRPYYVVWNSRASCWTWL